MALGDQVGKQAVDELDAVTIPEAQKSLTEVLAPFAALATALQALLAGGKRLVITLEDKP
jgi:hypothetical protein